MIRSFLAGPERKPYTIEHENGGSIRMSKPNNIQIRQMRDALQSMAESLETFKQKKGKQLSDGEVKAVNEAIRKALDTASAANETATRDTVYNFQTCVSRMDDAKKGLDATLQDPGRVKNVLTIAATVARLSAAAATGDVKSIVSAAGVVIDAVKV